MFIDLLLYERGPAAFIKTNRERKPCVKSTVADLRYFSFVALNMYRYVHNYFFPVFIVFVSNVMQHN